VAATVLVGESGVRAAVGTHLGHSDWLEITDARLALYTQATGDPDATYLAIGLSNMFLPQIVEVQGFAMGINYGTDTVTFVRPLHAGMRVRGGAVLVDVADVKGGVNGGVQTRMLITVEQDRDQEHAQDAPVCVIESISRWLH
jgi:acyl dehydratase